MWYSDKEKTGGADFPFGTKVSHENYEGKETVCEGIEEGITARDYFAATALNAIVASSCYGTAKDHAEYAYKLADAMLEARK